MLRNWVDFEDILGAWRSGGGILEELDSKINPNSIMSRQRDHRVLWSSHIHLMLRCSITPYTRGVETAACSTLFRRRRTFTRKSCERPGGDRGLSSILHLIDSSSQSRLITQRQPSPSSAFVWSSERFPYKFCDSSNSTSQSKSVLHFLSSFLILPIDPAKSCVTHQFQYTDFAHPDLFLKLYFLL